MGFAALYPSYELAGEAEVVVEGAGGLSVAEGLRIPGPGDGPAAGGGNQARGVQLIRVDIIDRRAGEDGYWDVAQVDGLLAGLRLWVMGFAALYPSYELNGYTQATRAITYLRDDPGYARSYSLNKTLAFVISSLSNEIKYTKPS
jgi:hypothetical protein